MLRVTGLEVNYGHIQALKGITFEVAKGTIVTLIGANGAGKSTTLRTLSGLAKARAGSIRFEDAEILNREAHEIVVQGIVHVPEGRRIFPALTVKENLAMAAWHVKSKTVRNQRFDEVFTLFPRLKERGNQLGGTLSGGEQQMLAVARALVTGGRLMLLDEPSMGLAPVFVEEIFNTIVQINKRGITILLVEQNAKKAFTISDYVYVLEFGAIPFHGSPEMIADDPKVKEAYLGI